MAGAQLWDSGGEGPEDVVVDEAGRVYTGLLDGRIVRFSPDGTSRETVVDTGGRPLGLEWGPDGTLVIADDQKGLLSWDGSLRVLVDRFEGEPFKLTNNAAVAQDGSVFFSVSSRFHHIDAFKADLLEHNASGRVFVWRPDGSCEQLMDGLCFANGVALSANEDRLLVAETGRYRVHRLFLQGPRAGESDVVLGNLPGFPDNLSRHGGEYWLALPSIRDALVDLMLPRPWMRKLVIRLPDGLQPAPKRHGFVIVMDEDGRVLRTLQDPSGRVAIVASARRVGDRLYLGSFAEPTLAVLDLE